MYKEMKTREIKELTTKEIQERLLAEKEQLVRLKLNHSISPLDNPLTIKETRRTIARYATELRQREINQQ
jgi:large subunit ribosomal protein L29